MSEDIKDRIPTPEETAERNADPFRKKFLVDKGIGGGNAVFSIKFKDIDGKEHHFKHAKYGVREGTFMHPLIDFPIVKAKKKGDKYVPVGKQMYVRYEDILDTEPIVKDE